MAPTTTECSTKCAIAISHRPRLLAFQSRSSRCHPGRDPLVPEAQRYGGAGRFLDFLLDEVKPLITDGTPGNREIHVVGSSMGGLFVSYVLLEKPDSFDQYIVASPALWWDDRLLVRTAAERPLLRGNAPARVFLAVGALEEGAGIPQLDRLQADQQYPRVCAVATGQACVAPRCVDARLRR